MSNQQEHHAVLTEAGLVPIEGLPAVYIEVRPGLVPTMGEMREAWAVGWPGRRSYRFYPCTTNGLQRAVVEAASACAGEGGGEVHVMDGAGHITERWEVAASWQAPQTASEVAALADPASAAAHVAKVRRDGERPSAVPAAGWSAMPSSPAPRTVKPS